jgi:hypothetical protein
MKPIMFDSGDGVQVHVFFVEVGDIEANLRNLLGEIEKSAEERKLGENRGM